jgi:DNA-binding PadR family transcriptional regulator
VKSLRSLFPETTLYTAISQMEPAGLLYAQEIDGARGSKPGYFYTEKGLEALETWAKWPPEKLVAPSTEMLLWISTIQVRRPEEMLEGIASLEEVLYEEELRVKLSLSETRRTRGDGLHLELEYELERAALEASRQFLAFARGLFEERVAAVARQRSTPN